MLSHMNEVDPFIFCYMFLYEIQNCIFHWFSQHKESTHDTLFDGNEIKLLVSGSNPRIQGFRKFKR